MALERRNAVFLHANNRLYLLVVVGSTVHTAVAAAPRMPQPTSTQKKRRVSSFKSSYMSK